MFNLNFTDYIDNGLSAVQVLCELEAMKAANDVRRSEGKAQAYDEDAFMALSERVAEIRRGL